MIDNLSRTSSRPENDYPEASLSHTHSLIKQKSVLPGGWEPDGMMVRYGQRTKKKRQMNASDGGIVKETPSPVNEEFRGKDEGEHMRCWSYGCSSFIGRRREMEDAVAVKLGLLSREGGSKQYHFFGVYDGHGGSHVAHACRDRLHELVVETAVETEDDHNINEDRRDGGGIDWEKVMPESFKKMDEEVNRRGAAVATIGSTAIVAVVGEEELVVANCGDSRAVLSRGGVAVPLSTDHKPDRADELERIELSGGKVINWNGPRVLGVLATSRSIGDHYLKPFVIPVPQVVVSQRSNMDEFLILASDGLWDVISNDMACHVVRRCLHGQLRRRARALSREMTSGERSLMDETAAGHRAERADGNKNGGPAAEAASILAELAIARGSGDNISVVVVPLERPKSLSCPAGGVGNCSPSKDEMVSS